MAKYTVTGMSCAACSSHVEKAVKRVPGVTDCSVSLLTNSMTVEGSASPKDIIEAVENAGYGAALFGSDTAEKNHGADADILKDTETPMMIKRLVSSLVVLAVLMYFSMGVMMWGFPVPNPIDDPVSLGLIEMLLAFAVLVINGKFFTHGFKGLVHKAPNMDTLVAIGSAASFGYSLAALLLIIYHAQNGDALAVADIAMKHLYFGTAAMIPTFITIGKTLESYSKGRTTDALKGLMKLAAKTANVERDGIVAETKIGDVKVGDIVIVRPGENIPVDGIVIEGETAVDESALTGESIPADKKTGDEVKAATISTYGFIRIRALRVGLDTTLSKVIKMVSDAQTTKAPIARAADKIAAVFVPAILLIALATLLGWLFFGAGFAPAFTRAVSVLVIACPCAMGLATPVAIMVGSGIGAKAGILFKTAAQLEQTGKLATVVLDKTGTITNGRPVVTDIYPVSCDEDTLIKLAASLESKSEHPLAKAVCEKAAEENAVICESDEFKILPGLGLSARINGEQITGGNREFTEKTLSVPLSDDIIRKTDGFAAEGKTPLYFSMSGALLGVIAVADTLKDESPEAIRQLRGMGIKTVMLTGDNEKTAASIGAAADVDDIIAGVLPDEKAEVIKKLKKEGLAAMVGDGINDAPALTYADTGIAIGAGSDIAIDAADIVLEKSSLADVPAAIRLSRQTLKVIRENLFWAFFYNVVCIPLAMGLYQALFGWDFDLSPAVGALAMSLSSVTVCLNALRLNLFDIYDAGHDRRICRKTEHKETKEMEKTIHIEGMMCAHCEATVKKALEALDGVENAEVSHEKGTAVVTLIKDVSREALKNAVEEKDFKVLSIE